MFFFLFYFWADLTFILRPFWLGPIWLEWKSGELIVRLCGEYNFTFILAYFRKSNATEFKTLTLFGKKILRAYVVLGGRGVIVLFRHLYKNTSHTTILLTHLTWFTCVIFYNSDVRVYIPCVLSFDLVKKTCIYRDKNYLPLWNFEVKFGMRFPISTYENDKFTSAVLIHLWS